jgi:hypothetical protein
VSTRYGLVTAVWPYQGLPNFLIVTHLDMNFCYIFLLLLVVLSALQVALQLSTMRHNPYSAKSTNLSTYTITVALSSFTHLVDTWHALPLCSQHRFASTVIGESPPIPSGFVGPVLQVHWLNLDPMESHL